MHQHKNEGHSYRMGDFNARRQCATNTEESQVIGKHTFQPSSAKPWDHRDSVWENRQFLIEWCISNKMSIANTKFQKLMIN